MSDRRQNLIGKRFGRGVVTRFAGQDKWKCHVWELVCDCGKLYKATTGNLNAGHVTSCGCYLIERVTENAKKATDAIRLPLGQAARHELYRSYLAHAKHLNIEFSITEDAFAELTKKDCVYCGSEPKTIYHMSGLNGDYIYNGIDRIDSTKSYSLENVVPCCKRCNHGKNDMSLTEFLEWVKRVYAKTHTVNAGVSHVA